MSGSLGCIAPGGELKNLCQQPRESLHRVGRCVSGGHRDGRGPGSPGSPGSQYLVRRRRRRRSFWSTSRCRRSPCGSRAILIVRLSAISHWLEMLRKPRTENGHRSRCCLAVPLLNCSFHTQCPRKRTDVPEGDAQGFRPRRPRWRFKVPRYRACPPDTMAGGRRLGVHQPIALDLGIGPQIWKLCAKLAPRARTAWGAGNRD